MNNESAFPKLTFEVDGQNNYVYRQEGGLTKLEHFSGLAMQGFLANRLEVPTTEGRKLVDFIAKCSVDYALALIAELEKHQ